MPMVAHCIEEPKCYVHMMICETAIKTKTKITFVVHGSKHGQRDDREIIAYSSSINDPSVSQ